MIFWICHNYNLFGSSKCNPEPLDKLYFTLEKWDLLWKTPGKIMEKRSWKAVWTMSYRIYPSRLISTNLLHQLRNVHRSSPLKKEGNFPSRRGSFVANKIRWWDILKYSQVAPIGGLGGKLSNSEVNMWLTIFLEGKLWLTMFIFHISPYLYLLMYLQVAPK